MSDFGTHVRIGFATHLIMLVMSLVSLLAGITEMVVIGITVGLPMTLAGAVFPDIDHPASKPYRFVEKWLPYVAASVVALLLAAEIGRIRTIIGTVFGVEYAGVYAGVTSTGLLWVVWTGVQRLFPLCRPSHRTVTHRISVGVAIAALVTGVGLVITASFAVSRAVLVAATWGLCFGVGFLSHLYCDDLLSGRNDD